MKLPNVNNFSRSVAKLLEDSITHHHRWGSNDLKVSKHEDLSSIIKKIRVKGLGIEQGVTMLPNDFQVNIKDLDFEYLSIDIQGPSYIRLDHQIKNGTVKISYKVSQEGIYVLEIKYQGVNVPGSPFNVVVKECEVKAAPVSNYKAVVAYGKGLKFSKKGEISSFQIDTRKAGDGRLSVYVDSPESRISRTECEVFYTATKDGCKVEYIGPNEGLYFLRVKYDGRHIKGSPFRAQCLPLDYKSPGGLFSSLGIKRKDPVVDGDKKRQFSLL